MTRDTEKRDEIAAVLTAAADVIFSDGVTTEFLEYWTNETLQLLCARTVSASNSAETITLEQPSVLASHL